MATIDQSRYLKIKVNESCDQSKIQTLRESLQSIKPLRLSRENNDFATKGLKIEILSK